MAERLYGATECVKPVPLERWDLERVAASTDILQVGCLALVPAELVAGVPSATAQDDQSTTATRTCIPAPAQSGALRFAAWLDGVAAFDEGLVRLSRAEAVGLDPQCRLLLEHAWAAMQVGGRCTGDQQPCPTLPAQPHLPVRPVLALNDGPWVQCCCRMRVLRWLAPRTHRLARMWAVCGASTKSCRWGT